MVLRATVGNIDRHSLTLLRRSLAELPHYTYVFSHRLNRILNESPADMALILMHGHQMVLVRQLAQPKMKIETPCDQDKVDVSS